MRDEIVAISSWLAEPNARRRTCNPLLLAESTARNARIFAQRYGSDGEDRTLEAIGMRFGVTRERVRQICAKMLGRSSGVRFATPVIDQLIADIQPLLPATLSLLGETFGERLGPGQSILGLYEFGTEVLATRVFEVQRNVTGHTVLRDEPVACRVGDSPSSSGRAIYEMSCKMIRTCGAAQAQFVYGLCAHQGAVFNYASFQSLLQALPGFEWLEERTGWFWLGQYGPADNKALHVTWKILAVSTQRVDIAHVVSALARSRRRINVTVEDAFELEVDAPRSVLVELMRRTPGIEIRQMDDVVLSAPLHPEEVLSQTELLVRDALLARGGIGSWSELRQALCGDLGVLPITFHMTIGTSPIIEALDHGLYRLVGNFIGTEAALSTFQRWQASAKGLASKQSNGSKASQDEVVVVHLKPPPVIFRSGAFDAPSSLKPFLLPDTSYSVEGFERAVATRSYDDGRVLRIRGMHRALAQRGIGPGDTVRVELYPAARRFVLSKAQGEAVDVEEPVEDDSEADWDPAGP